MKYAIMVLALVGVLAPPTAASAVTGNKMFELCKLQPAMCLAYEMGWRDHHDLVVISAEFKRRGWFNQGLMDKDFANSKEALKAARRAAVTNVCFPPQSTNEQVKDILINYLRDHPEKRHRPITHLAQFSFVKAFPCRQLTDDRSEPLRNMQNHIYDRCQ